MTLSRAYPIRTDEIQQSKCWALPLGERPVCVRICLGILLAPSIGLVLSQLPSFVTPYTVLVVISHRLERAWIEHAYSAYVASLSLLSYRSYSVFLKACNARSKNRTWGSFDVHLIDNNSVIFKTHKNVETCFTCIAYKTLLTSYSAHSGLSRRHQFLAAISNVCYSAVSTQRSVV